MLFEEKNITKNAWLITENREDFNILTTLIFIIKTNIIKNNNIVLKEQQNTSLCRNHTNNSLVFTKKKNLATTEDILIDRAEIMVL